MYARSDPEPHRGMRAPLTVLRRPLLHGHGLPPAPPAGRPRLGRRKRPPDANLVIETRDPGDHVLPESAGSSTMKLTETDL